MAKARYFEIGVACLEIIAVLLAILVAVYVSIWTGLLLLVLLLLAPQASAECAPYAPSFVIVATTTDAAVLVSFLPGSQVADSYNIYGLAPGAPPTMLGTFTPSAPTDALSFVAPAGFDAYAVSGVLGGVESPMISTTSPSASAAAGGDPCIDLDPSYIVIRCIPIIGTVDR